MSLNFIVCAAYSQLARITETYILHKFCNYMHRHGANDPRNASPYYGGIFPVGLIWSVLPETALMTLP